MNKTVTLVLAAFTAAFMLSCGNGVLGVGGDSKRETKVQFYNGLYYLGSLPFVAEFWLDDTNENFGQRTQSHDPMRAQAMSGAWSELLKINHCEKEALHEIHLYDGPYAMYVFRNVPLQCEKDNKYEVYEYGGWPTYRWIVAD